MRRSRVFTGECRADARSRVTNGTRLFLAGYDGRTAAGRRLRDLMIKFAEPFGSLAACDEHTRQLVRRVATLSLQAEIMEARAATGIHIDSARFAKVSNSIARLLRKLEAREKPKQPPRLAEVLAKEDAT